MFADGNDIGPATTFKPPTNMTQFLAATFLASLAFLAYHVMAAPRGHQDEKGFHVTQRSPLVNHKRLTIVLLVILNLALVLLRWTIL